MISLSANTSHGAPGGFWTAASLPTSHPFLVQESAAQDRKLSKSPFLQPSEALQS